jgi:RsiW-degrading membrane proteinase PrsW (M82 family)
MAVKIKIEKSFAGRVTCVPVFLTLASFLSAMRKLKLFGLYVLYCLCQILLVAAIAYVACEPKGTTWLSALGESLFLATPASILPCLTHYYYFVAGGRSLKRNTVVEKHTGSFAHRAFQRFSNLDPLFIGIVAGIVAMLFTVTITSHILEKLDICYKAVLPEFLSTLVYTFLHAFREEIGKALLLWFVYRHLPQSGDILPLLMTAAVSSGSLFAASESLIYVYVQS